MSFHKKLQRENAQQKFLCMSPLLFVTLQIIKYNQILSRLQNFSQVTVQYFRQHATHYVEDAKRKPC